MSRSSILSCAVQLLILLSVLFLAACGGNNTLPVVSQPVTITVTPSTTTGVTGTAITFIANVSNSSNTAVTWSIQEGSTAGTITNAGVFTPAAPGTFHIVATSAADNAKSANATVTITSTIAVTVSPVTTSGVAGTPIPFTASVANTTNSAVSWRIEEGTTAGAISGGVFTPARAGTFHVTVISQADASKTATAIVTVAAPAPVFTSAAPSAATEGQTYTYSPVVTDPAKSAITVSLISAPAGATLTSGQLTWTPSHAQSRIANDFSLKATTAAGGSGTQSFTITPSGTVTGLALITHVTESGDVETPRDGSNDIVKIHAPNGSSFTSLAGSGNSAGLYTIDGVPAGSFWLQIGTDYIWTARSEIDLGMAVAGREGLRTASTGTSVSVSTSNLNPLFAKDRFEVFVPNAGVLSDMQIPSFTPGQTTATLDFSWTNLNLVEASAGDNAYLAQLSSTTLSSGQHIYFVMGGSPAFTFSSIDGSSASASTTMYIGAAPLASAHGIFYGADWTAMNSAVNPAATPRGTQVSMGVQGMGNSHGSLTWPNPRLAAYFGEDGAISTYLNLLVSSVPNPYPSQWPLVLEYDQPFGIPLTLPGSTNAPITLVTHARVQQDTSSPMVYPLVTPVIAPQINGQDAFAAATGVGTSPTLSWTAPTDAVGYRILIERLYDDGGVSAVENVAVLNTSETSFRVPPGIMTAGNYYFFIIQAHSEPGADYTYSPYRHALPHGMAPAVTALVTP